MAISSNDFPKEYEVIRAVWDMWSSGQEIGDVEKLAYYVVRERIYETLYAKDGNNRNFLKWNESQIGIYGIREELNFEIPCGHSTNPVLDDFLLGLAVETAK
ncbi:MAG: hypothetical protein WC494_02040 [Candidatus Pacearchaeota archaeon]